MQKEFEYPSSLTSVANISLGAGGYRFLHMMSPGGLRIRVPTSLVMQPQLRLEQQLLDAIQDYMKVLDKGTEVPSEEREAVRLRLERIQFKNDLCRRVNLDLISYSLSGNSDARPIGVRRSAGSCRALWCAR